MVECAFGFSLHPTTPILQDMISATNSFLKKTATVLAQGIKLAVTCDRSFVPGTKRRTKFFERNNFVRSFGVQSSFAWLGKTKYAF